MLSCVPLLCLGAAGLPALLGLPVSTFLTLYVLVPAAAGVLQCRLCREGYAPQVRQLPALAAGGTALLCGLTQSGAIPLSETSFLSDSEALFALPDQTLLTASAVLSLAAMILGTLAGRREV